MKKSFLSSMIILSLAISLYGCDAKSKPDTNVSLPPATESASPDVPTNPGTSSEPGIPDDDSLLPTLKNNYLPGDELPEFLQYLKISPANPDDYGRFEDVYTTTDYVYLEGELIDICLDKDVTYHGNLLSDVEKIMRKIEEITGLSYYPDFSLYAAASRCGGTRELYFGCDPFPEHPEHSDKLQLIVVVDRDNIGLSNCALGNQLVVVDTAFDLYDEECGPAVLVHELMHTIQERNSHHLLIDGDKLAEGYAAYHEHVICDALPEFPFPEDRRTYYRDFIGTLNAETAEEVCTTPFLPIYGTIDEQYYVGYGMIQYMIEQAGGEETFNRFLENASARVENYYDTISVDIQRDALLEVYGDDFYQKFGAWYEANHTCTNRSDSIWGVYIGSDDDLSYNEFRSMIYDAEPGSIVTLDRTAIISPNYYLDVVDGITLSITDTGSVMFSGDLFMICVEGILELPNFDCLNADQEWPYTPFLYLYDDGVLRINGIEISRHPTADENPLMIDLTNPQKPGIAQTLIEVDVKGGDDALTTFHNTFDTKNIPSEFIHVIE